MEIRAMISVHLDIVTEWDKDSIVKLYRSAGWWKEAYDPGEIPILIRSSYLFVIGTILDTGETVAMGRILSDRITTGIIQDMCVLPDYRGRGIGRELLRFLINSALKKGISRIFLVSEPGTESFYQKSGFIFHNNHIFLIYTKQDMFR